MYGNEEKVGGDFLEVWRVKDIFNSLLFCVYGIIFDEREYEGNYGW